MSTNFLKVAYRTLFRNKVFSFINISGLAIGMASAMLILLWIQHELSYDNFHRNKDRIYEVWNRVPVEGKMSAWSSVSALLARTLEKDLPEVEQAVRVTDRNLLLATGDKKIKADGYIVDTGFLQMFSYPLLNGNKSSSLINSHSIVLTEKTAKALFGKEDPLGEIINIDNSESFTVSGVLKNLPDNTSFQFDYLLPWSFVKYKDGQDLGWNDNSTNTYVMLKPNTEYTAVAQKIKDLKQKYHDESKTLKWELFLYPLKKWHLYSSFTNGVEDNKGRSTFVKLFAVIATFILLIACINFMNLSTARSEKRAREVGIRKVIGAGKSSLIRQFLVESVLISFLSGIAALIFVQLALPAFNQLTGKQLFLNFSNVYTWIAFAGFVLFTGLLAGSYPAFFLSSFRPIKVLKGILKTPNALISPRKTLVVVQFAFATILIICTIVIKQQIDHARNRDAGYNKENLIYHYINRDIARNYQLIKNELIAEDVAKSVTKNNSPLTNRGSDGWGQNWEGKDPNDRTSFNRLLSDEDLGTTAGLQFLQGRDFDLKKFPADSTGLIINESALRVMKFTDPIGKTVSDLGNDWHVVGVIKDFI